MAVFSDGRSALGEEVELARESRAFALATLQCLVVAGRAGVEIAFAAAPVDLTRFDGLAAT